MDLVKGKVFPALTVNKSEILGIGAVGAAILSKLMEEEILEEIPSADGFLRVKKSSKIKNIKIKTLKILKRFREF